MPLRTLSETIPGPGTYVTSGAMNRRFTFYSPGVRSLVDGSTGQASAQFEVWGALYGLSGAEADRAQQIAQKLSHLLVIGYRLGLAENMTALYLDGAARRVFQIVVIKDWSEQRQQLFIYCNELGQSAGQGV